MEQAGLNRQELRQALTKGLTEDIETEALDLFKNRIHGFTADQQDALILLAQRIGAVIVGRVVDTIESNNARLH